MNARVRKALIAIAFGGLAAGCATLERGAGRPAPAVQPLYLVGHPDLVLQPAQARELFLGDAEAGDSAALVPVDNAPVLDEFLRKLLKVDRARYEKLWSRRAFRDGTEPPPRFRNDAEVNDYVRRTPGAVGYVRAPGSRVKVLGKL